MVPVHSLVGRNDPGPRFRRGPAVRCSAASCSRAGTCWLCGTPAKSSSSWARPSARSSPATRPRSSRPLSAGPWRCRKGRATSVRTTSRCSSCIYDILMKIRKEGVWRSRHDLEKPEDSALFQKYPMILDDHHMVMFITDCLRLIVGGNLDPHELESLLEYELETHHKEAHEPAHAVQKVADALPGFGIVAAVLGIVNTMSALEGADTATIGHKVGAALVGTFLGILVAYGFVGPIATAMEHRARRRRQSLRSGEDGAGGERARLRAAGRGGVRAQAAVQRSASDLRRARSELKGKPQERLIDRPMAAKRKATSETPRAAYLIKRVQEGRRRPSRRRLESGVRGLRHRDDGVLPGDVAGHRRVEGTARGHLRLLQEPQHGARQEREARAGTDGAGRREHEPDRSAAAGSTHRAPSQQQDRRHRLAGDDFAGAAHRPQDRGSEGGRSGRKRRSELEQEKARSADGGSEGGHQQEPGAGALQGSAAARHHARKACASRSSTRRTGRCSISAARG